MQHTTSNYRFKKDMNWTLFNNRNWQTTLKMVQVVFWTCLRRAFCLVQACRCLQNSAAQEKWILSFRMHTDGQVLAVHLKHHSRWILHRLCTTLTCLSVCIWSQHFAQCMTEMHNFWRHTCSTLLQFTFWNAVWIAIENLFFNETPGSYPPPSIHTTLSSIYLCIRQDSLPVLKIPQQPSGFDNLKKERHRGGKNEFGFASIFSTRLHRVVVSNSDRRQAEL